MRRILLRLLNPPIIVLLACLAVALQGTLFRSFPLLWLQPDLLLALVLWMALKRPFEEGGILTLVIANVAELHSSSPRGVFMISYMAVFLGARLAVRLFVLPDYTAWLRLTMVASVTWKAAALATLAFLGKASLQWRHTVMHLLPDAVTAALAGHYAYQGLHWLDNRMHKNEQAEQRLSDDLQLAEEGGT